MSGVVTRTSGIKSGAIAVSALLCGGVFFLFSCTKEETATGATPPGAIRGKVVDSSGAPVSGANVFTVPPTASVMTDATGDYAIASADVGEYRVVAAKATRGGSRSIRVRSGETTVADIPFESGNRFPDSPRLVRPGNGNSTPPAPILEWQCSDPDSDQLVYDVFLDAADPPRTLVASDLVHATLGLTDLQVKTKYYWCVVARDRHFGVRVGPTWSFVTSLDSSLAGLVAWYPLDGNAVDKSEYANHGMPSGTTTTQNRIGEAGRALQFNGRNAWVKIPDRPQLHPSKQLTIAVWVRLDSVVSNWSPIIHKGGEASGTWYNNRSFALLQKAHVNNTAFYCFYSAGDESVQHEVNTGGAEMKMISPGEWVFIVCTVDRVNHAMHVWWNGTWHRQVADTYSTITANTNDLMLGWWEESTPDNLPFKGAVDDLRIYDRPLSPGEIESLFARTD